VFIVSVIV